MEDKLKKWLTVVIGGLVKSPDKISIEVEQDEEGILLAVKVADGEGGMVIGQGGNIAKALRTIVRSAGKNQNDDVRVSLRLDIPLR